MTGATQDKMRVEHNIRSHYMMQKINICSFLILGTCKYLQSNYVDGFCNMSNLGRNICYSKVRIHCRAYFLNSNWLPIKTSGKTQQMHAVLLVLNHSGSQYIYSRPQKSYSLLANVLLTTRTFNVIVMTFLVQFLFEYRYRPDR
jgi:hypothetical protein